MTKDAILSRLAELFTPPSDELRQILSFSVEQLLGFASTQLNEAVEAFSPAWAEGSRKTYVEAMDPLLDHTQAVALLDFVEANPWFPKVVRDAATRSAIPSQKLFENFFTNVGAFLETREEDEHGILAEGMPKLRLEEVPLKILGGGDAEGSR